MHRRIKDHPIIGNSIFKEIKFYFNNKEYKALDNEMISSALIANGIQIFGHHFKDGSPNGIFCANGQCSQCLVIADKKPVKACITQVKDNMRVFSVEGLPELSNIGSNSDQKEIKTEKIKTKILIVGSGPAGLNAAIELAQSGEDIVIIDDKNIPGGKLTLQTHSFFGEREMCFAGERGIDIGKILSDKLKEYKNISLWLNSPLVGIYSDKKIGVVKNGQYLTVETDYLLVTTGAREKMLSFPGSDLPGVYGAGAFQTLVNRDKIKSSNKIFIIGGGNVGLIAAYHAAQAGIIVTGVAEAMPECGGYKVHADKIKRLGIPIYNSHSIIEACGKDKLEKIIISKVNSYFLPIKGTEQEFEVDTLLIAVGLWPISEIYRKAKDFNFNVYSAGDAESIAEASSAIFSGKIIGRKMLIDMGYDISIPHEWYDISEVLKSRPGITYPLSQVLKPTNEKIYPIIRCNQEIPCNPCVDSCSNKCIQLKGKSIMDIPIFMGNCTACGKCVAICPGLAITLVNNGYDETLQKALVILPWEMGDTTLKLGDVRVTTDYDGNAIGLGKVIKIQTGKWMNRRKFVYLEVPYSDADLVAGIELQKCECGKTPSILKEISDDKIIICRCERVTKKQVLDMIKDGCRDFNALKAQLRVGMGACGGKTCTQQIINIYRECGVPMEEIEEYYRRPLDQEVSVEAFLS